MNGLHECAEWRTLTEEVSSLYEQRDYDGAIAVAKKALDTAELALGPDHPDVADSLADLAVLYDVRGQYAAALPLFERALAIRE